MDYGLYVILGLFAIAMIVSIKMVFIMMNEE
jgi:hypothetical protein